MSERHALFKISGPGLDRDEITVTPKGMQFGRSGDNDLALPHSEISRRHMRLFQHEDGFAVEDLKSSNGVWVNDVRIRTETPHPIKPGDVIRAGPYLLTFDSIAEVEAEAPKPKAAPPPPSPEPEPPIEVVGEAKPEKPKDTNGKKEPAAKKPSKRKEEKTAEPEVKPDEEEAISEASAAKTVPPQEEPRPQIEIEPAPYLPRADGDGFGRLESRDDGSLLPLETNGHLTYPIGIPTDASNWLKYLPAIYSDDQFIGRYLLIFESILSPISWVIDNFDMFLSPEVAPPEWLQWMAAWFDVIVVPELPIARQRAIVEQLGWLFFRRGTKAGLERLLTLYFGTKPEIVESSDEAHFSVKLYLSESNVKLDHDIVDRLIMAHKPAHASYTLEIE
jgi:phage tail-like protein